MRERHIRENIDYTNNFKKIITFYLFETPIEDTTSRGFSFKELGWNGSSRFQMMERLMKEASDINEKDWVICNRNEIADKSSCIDKNKQYIICNNDKGKVKSVIYSIRNAFAHGAFRLIDDNGNIIYYMENIHKDKLKADLAISEETLINWIKIFKTKPEYLTKKTRKNKDLLKVISNI